MNTAGEKENIFILLRQIMIIANERKKSIVSLSEKLFALFLTNLEIHLRKKKEVKAATIPSADKIKNFSIPD